jgi:hypothetical protein
MKLASFDALVSALQQAGVRYLIAGGLAVNAHGYLRFTKDVDLVLQLGLHAPTNARLTAGGVRGQPPDDMAVWRSTRAAVAALKYAALQLLCCGPPASMRAC